MIENTTYLTIRDAGIGISRPEFEYTIRFEDGEQMLQNLCRRPLIETRSKIRWVTCSGKSLSLREKIKGRFWQRWNWQWKSVELLSGLAKKFQANIPNSYLAKHPLSLTSSTGSNANYTGFSHCLKSIMLTRVTG